MDSNNMPLKKDMPYTIFGKCNGIGQEKTFIATFIKQDEGSEYIVIKTAGPGIGFYQHINDIKSIKPATFLDRLYI